MCLGLHGGFCHRGRTILVRTVEDARDVDQMPLQLR